MKRSDMGEEKSSTTSSSSFLATCNLLNKFLKQKGSLNDLIASAAASSSQESSKVTMSLLQGLEVAEQENDPRKKMKNSTDEEQQHTAEPMDLFPVITPESKITQKAEEQGEQKGQLTIFYGGKVLVFDEFPSDKAKCLIEMAGKTSVAMKDFGLGLPKCSLQQPTEPVVAASTSASNEKQILALDQSQKTTQPNASNMRVARRASLHKFLEKRKDRMSAKVPYQVNESLQKPEEENHQQLWPGMSSSSKKPSSS